MHELAIVANIVKIVEDEISTRHLKGSVEKVLFRAGRLHAVVPDILTFNFDVMKRDRPWLRDAVLEVAEVPIRVTCKACKKSAVIEEPFFLCLECGSAVTVDAGEELFVERISFREET
jgi:hydrogenase nickel incorporation protein HypA/HybF